MKTNLLTLMIFVIASVFYSCSKESDADCPSNSTKGDETTLTTAQRRIIISNCASHAGCHAGAKVMQAGTINQINSLLRKTVDASHQLSVCDRGKLQSWLNGEVNQ